MSGKISPSRRRFVEAKDELVEVAGKVLARDPVEGAPQPGLEVREDRVAPREEAHGAGSIEPLDHALVSDFHPRQGLVAVQPVRVQRGPRALDGAAYEGTEIVHEGVAREHSEPELALGASLHHRADQALAAAGPSAAAALLMRGAEIRLVRLHGPASSRPGSGPKAELSLWSSSHAASWLPSPVSRCN